MIERKIKDVFGGEQFELRRGKENRYTVGILRIISEQTLETSD